MLRRRRLPVMLSGGGVRCPEWTITDRGSELELEAEGVIVDIYDHGLDRTGRQFLISGRFELDLGTVKALLEVLTSRLRARGLAHNLELGNTSGDLVLTMQYVG
jgi:hypothetical protein